LQFSIVHLPQAVLNCYLPFQAVTLGSERRPRPVRPKLAQRYERITSLPLNFSSASSRNHPTT
jgi:hypothetical protein